MWVLHFFFLNIFYLDIIILGQLWSKSPLVEQQVIVTTTEGHILEQPVIYVMYGSFLFVYINLH